MRFSNAMQQAMNDQIGREFGAAHLYLAMSAWFAERNYDGFAKWMRIQSREESAHAMKLFDYLLDRGGRVALQAVPQPKAPWKTPLQVFAAAARHEAEVSSSIHQLYEKATREKDYSTQVMLQWFLTEQVEEEKTSAAIVDRLRLIGDSPSGLLLLDRALGERGPE
jgi:ferritin